MSYSPKIEWELSIKQSPPTQDILDKQKRKDRNHGQKFLHIVAHQRTAQTQKQRHYPGFKSLRVSLPSRLPFGIPPS